jgi:leucyl-tRNA synthetase
MAPAMGDLLDMAWPSVDETALQRDEIELMLQINGKLRGSLTVPANADKAFIEQAAAAHEQVTKQAAGAAAQENHRGTWPLGQRGAVTRSATATTVPTITATARTPHERFAQQLLKPPSIAASPWRATLASGALMSGVAATGLSGCGFQLRQSADLPFKSLFLILPRQSALGTDLRRNLASQANLKVFTEGA